MKTCSSRKERLGFLSLKSLAVRAGGEHPRLEPVGVGPHLKLVGMGDGRFRLGVAVGAGGECPFGVKS